MERKTLTLQRPSIEKGSESAEPIIQRRRKQVVVNTQRKPNKPAKTTPTASPKKATPQPEKKKDTVVTPLEKKVTPLTPPKQHFPLEVAIANLSEYWPHLFPNGQLRPMVVGIREALMVRKMDEWFNGAITICFGIRVC